MGNINIPLAKGGEKGIPRRATRAGGATLIL